MTKSKSPLQPGSISSEQTDGSAHSDAILALGRELVDELGREASRDTLGCWMAHYIAGLIVRAENETGEQKCLAEKRCFESILMLWRHRAELPNGKRPFSDIEPVVRAIESLDPEVKTPRYYVLLHDRVCDIKDEPEAKSWIDIANRLDDTAKILIAFCLREAAQAASDKSQKWVELAEAAGADKGAIEIVIKFISSSADVGKELDLNCEVRRQMESKIKQLDDFIKQAETVVNELTKRLEALPSLSEGGVGENIYNNKSS